jgi:glycosyltransferase involved in cell wall biosynthesis
MNTIFILCYNEEVLLPHTIKHYKTHLPNSTIIIYDNYSTDNSVKIAKEHGCIVIQWDSNNEINDYRYLTIKNHCWKMVKSGWIIVADMDEWLCVTEEDLVEEKKKNTCILTVKGYDIVGKSNTYDLSDISLQDIKMSVYCPDENKCLCFNREAVREMNYEPGAHKCKPVFSTKSPQPYSKKIYINKHMNYLGLKYIIQKMFKRYERSKRMREQYQLATHYTNNIREITNRYLHLIRSSSSSFMCPRF